MKLDKREMRYWLNVSNESVYSFIFSECRNLKHFHRSIYLSELCSAAVN